MNLKPLENILLKFVSKTQKEMKQILQKNNKGYTRIAKQTSYFKVKITDKSISLTTTLPDYAIYVDKGRKPGKMPPLKAIAEWSKRKRINPKYNYAIAKKIGKEGIPPTNFLKPIKNLRVLIQEMNKEYGKIINNEINIDLKKYFKK